MGFCAIFFETFNVFYDVLCVFNVFLMCFMMFYDVLNMIVGFGLWLEKMDHRFGFPLPIGFFGSLS